MSSSKIEDNQRLNRFLHVGSYVSIFVNYGNLIKYVLNFH